jgi:hypothetical protein
MRKWVRLGLAGMAVLAAVQALRPRREARGGFCPGRVLLVFLLTQLRWDWDPLHWASEAEKDLKGIVKAVWKWVVKECIALGNLVWNDVFNVYKTLTTVTGVIESEVSYLFGQIGSEVGVGVKFIKKLIADAVKAAEAGLRDLVSAVDSFAHAVYRDADNWYHDAVGFVIADERWWWDHVIDPAIRDVEGAGKDIYKLFDEWWQTIDRDVIRPIEHDASEALSDAKKVLYWIDHGALDAVHLVEACFDFLTYVSDHPLSSLEQTAYKLPGEIIQAWGPALESKIADYWQQQWNKVLPVYDNVITQMAGYADIVPPPQ